jgi:uncharacterized protein (TIGR00369 family)
MRDSMHPNCVLCGLANGRSLRLHFTVCDDGSVSALFGCHDVFEGYAGQLHGGVITSLLDGAMTNCLFARGISAVTAELNVRFRHPVVSGESATVRAWVERSSSPLHVLRAEIVQADKVRAAALGKFMERRASPWDEPAR